MLFLYGSDTSCQGLARWTARGCGSDETATELADGDEKDAEVIVRMGGRQISSSTDVFRYLDQTL